MDRGNPAGTNDPNAITPKGPFLRVYFPTLPRSGQLHLRKLWEACTKRVTESANVGVELQLNSRTVGITTEYRKNSNVNIHIQTSADMPAFRRSERVVTCERTRSGVTCACIFDLETMTIEHRFTDV